jgi:hypothetical protein
VLVPAGCRRDLCCRKHHCRSRVRRCSSRCTCVKQKQLSACALLVGPAPTLVCPLSTGPVVVAAIWKVSSRLQRAECTCRRRRLLTCTPRNASTASPRRLTYKSRAPSTPARPLARLDVYPPTRAVSPVAASSAPHTSTFPSVSSEAHFAVALPQSAQHVHLPTGPVLGR